MATSDKKTRWYSKKLLGLDALKTGFADFLAKQLNDLAANVWGTSGFFSPGVGISILVADKFSLTGVPAKAIDSSGRMLFPANADVTNVSFANALATTYYLGLEYAEAPSGVETNPRTGEYKYKYDTQLVGKGPLQPDSVTDNGNSTITVFVTPVTEANVSYAGRSVMVWFHSEPKAAADGDAIKTVTVIYDAGAGKNKITTSTLGQGATPSINVADYRIALIGPRVSLGAFPGEAGVAIIGSIVGGGAGNPPQSASTGLQRIFSAGGLAPLAEVTEKDAHGFWKVRVKADVDDVGVRQLAVEDANGNERFRVTESGQLLVKTSDGTRYVELLPGADPRLRLVDLATTAEVVNADGVLKLKDNNTPASIAFSSPSDTAIGPLLPATILGALNRIGNIQDMLANTWNDRLIGGGTLSNGGGLNVSAAAANFWMAGMLVARNPQILALPDGATRYVYADSTSGDLAASATITLPATNDVMLGRVVTAGGVITSIDDMRVPVQYQLPHEITVGPAGTGAMFTSLKDALQVVGEYAAPTAGSPGIVYKIKITGPITIASVDCPLVMPASGITIEGIKGAAVITWSAENALFDFNGKSDLVFRDLSIRFSSAVALPGPQGRVVFYNSVAGNLYRVVVENVEVLATNQSFHGFMELVHGTLRDSLIANCQAYPNDFGIRIYSSGIVRDTVIRDCVFGGIGVVAGADPHGIYLLKANDVLIDGVRCSGFDGNGIRIGATASPGVAESARVQVTGCTVYDTGSTGISIVGGNRCTVAASVVRDAADEEANDQYGIRLYHDKNIVNGCDVSVKGTGAASNKAIYIGVGSKNIVTSCQFNSYGFTDVPAGSTFANNRDDA